MEAVPHEQIVELVAPPPPQTQPRTALPSQRVGARPIAKVPKSRPAQDADARPSPPPKPKPSTLFGRRLQPKGGALQSQAADTERRARQFVRAVNCKFQNAHKACQFAFDKAPRDSWERTFDVVCQPERDGLVLRSAAEDGKFYTDDDIVWQGDPTALVSDCDQF